MQNLFLEIIYDTTKKSDVTWTFVKIKEQGQINTHYTRKRVLLFYQIKTILKTIMMHYVDNLTAVFI